MRDLKIRIIAVIAFAVVSNIGGSAALCEDLVISSVFVQMDQVEIPSRKSGVIKAITSREGSDVKADQEVARLDDQIALIELKNAEKEWQLAGHEAGDKSPIDLAKKKQEKEKQTLIQIQIQSKAARRQAENELKIKAAQKARDVASNELARAKRARSEFADAVSQSEIDGLQLTLDQATLEAAQASFEQQQQTLAADASDENARVQELAIQQSGVEIKQAESKQITSQLAAGLQQGKVDAAKLNLEHHRIRSAFPCVIIELLKQEGEWVKPGDAVMRVLRLDRLKVEGFLPISQLRESMVGAPATISLIGLQDKRIEVSGRVSFVSPQVDAVNKEVAVWAEFEKGDFQIRPGMQGSMTIHLGKL